MAFYLQTLYRQDRSNPLIIFITRVYNLALIREFRYEYAAVSPWDGALDFMTAEKMNTESMVRFLEQVYKAHRDQSIIMVVEGASFHRSKVLDIPKNVSFIKLTPYHRS